MSYDGQKVSRRSLFLYSQRLQKSVRGIAVPVRRRLGKAMPCTFPPGLGGWVQNSFRTRSGVDSLEMHGGAELCNALKVLYRKHCRPKTTNSRLSTVSYDGQKVSRRSLFLYSQRLQKSVRGIAVPVRRRLGKAMPCTFPPTSEGFCNQCLAGEEGPPRREVGEDLAVRNLRGARRK